MSFFKKLFEKKQIDMNNIPKHIAIIMDGNGRWAKRRGLPRSAGHREGAQTLMNIAQACQDLGVEYLTVYAFSTENWKRPKEEVDYLMDLLREYVKKLREDKKNKSKIKMIGDISGLSEDLQKNIIETEEMTRKNPGIQLNIALNYGGRDEIHNAVKEIIKDYKDGKIDDEFIENLKDKEFSTYLHTKDMPDPDLIIRPSGELRLSNFLLYQCAYSELWFAKINWPDFNKDNLLEAISDYQNRNRRFGGI